MSDISDISDISDSSIYDEIDQLIDQCHQLHTRIHNSCETLQTIQSLVANHKNINVTYNNITCDFDELLESFHQIALNNIKENGSNTFGKQLLDTIGNSIFT